MLTWKTMTSVGLNLELKITGHPACDLYRQTQH